MSKVTTKLNLFTGATSFNQNLSIWNVLKVMTTYQMFKGAYSFNGNLNSWEVSKVNSMYGTFWSATSFNNNLQSWNMAFVGDTASMVEGARSFNQTLNSWNVSAVTTSNEPHCCETTSPSGPLPLAPILHILGWPYACLFVTSFLLGNTLAIRFLEHSVGEAWIYACADGVGQMAARE